MDRLQGRVGIVTGGGRGIGREIARAFAAEGCAVAVVARTAAQVEDACAAIRASGGRALGMVMDVTDRWEVEELTHRVERELGPTDILVNNAGSFGALGPLTEVEPDAWWHDVTVNLLGPFLCARAVLPGMIGRGAGRIINMVGGGMASPFPYGSGYASSKAALMRLTETMDREVCESGVRVFAMGPGLVRTAMTEHQMTTPAGRRWFPWIKERFEMGKDVSPALAAELALAIASGALDELHGRGFGVGDDVASLLQNRERIIREDLNTLRFRELQGPSATTTTTTTTTTRDSDKRTN